MVIIEAILNHYIMLALMVGLWFMLESGVHVKKKIVDITKIIIVSIFVEATLWSIEYWTRELDSYTIARPLLTATIYLLHSLIVIEMMNMSELKKDNERWIYVPFAVCVPLFYASQWTKWIFFYDRDNLYHASNAFIEYLPYYLFIFYVLIFMVRFYKRFSTIDSRDKRGIILGITVAMAGVGLIIVLKQDVDYSTLFAAILVLYYLFLYINRAKSDPLTKLLNRQCYYSDIKRDDAIITAVVSVDMNDLKMLNDNYGHDAGDAALVSVAECLLNGDTTKKHIY